MRLAAGSAVAPPLTLQRGPRQALQGVRLGVFRPWLEHADAEVVACAERALRTAADLGAQVLPLLRAGSAVDCGAGSSSGMQALPDLALRGPARQHCRAAVRHREPSGSRPWSTMAAARGAAPAQVVDVTIPHLGMSRVAHACIIGTEFAHGTKPELRAGLRTRCAPSAPGAAPPRGCQPCPPPHSHQARRRLALLRLAVHGCRPGALIQSAAQMWRARRPAAQPCARSTATCSSCTGLAARTDTAGKRLPPAHSLAGLPAQWLRAYLRPLTLVARACAA